MPDNLTWFIYPRLLLGHPMGYDWGYFLAGQYKVCGNSSTEANARICIRQLDPAADVEISPVASDDRHNTYRGEAPPY